MEYPQFSDNERIPRQEKAIRLFAEGMLFLVADNFDEELAAIDDIEYGVQGEIESSLDNTERRQAIDTLVSYGFEPPSDILLHWHMIDEEMHNRDGFLEIDPSEEVFSICFSYLNAEVTFFVSIVQDGTEVLLEKEISLQEIDLSPELASEKYSGVFSSDDVKNRSLIETLLQNNIVKDDAKEIVDVTDRELNGLVAMIQVLRENE